MSPRKTRDNPLGLEPFGGCAVTKAGIEISNASGGLHSALEVDNALASNVARTDIGDMCYVLLRCDVTKVRFQPVKGDEDQLRRVSIMRCTDATLVEGEFAVDAINSQRDRIREAEERLAGQMTLTGDGGADGPPEPDPGDVGEGFD